MLTPSNIACVSAAIAIVLQRRYVWDKSDLVEFGIVGDLRVGQDLQLHMLHVIYNSCRFINAKRCMTLPYFWICHLAACSLAGIVHRKPSMLPSCSP